MLPWYRPHLILSSSEMQPISQKPRQPVVMEGLAEIEKEPNPDLIEQISKLESILLEKNRSIERLEKKLKAEWANRLEFEKVKNILDEEIVYLRTQNKELKTKIGDKNA
jgi:hypothetical protein